MTMDQQATTSSAVSATPPPSGPVRQRRTARRSVVDLLRESLVKYGMVWVLIILALVANGLYPGFFDPENLNNVVYQVAPVGIVAVGMTFVVIGGGFDLSVAASFAGASVAFAGLSNSVPLWLAFVLTAALGVLAGVINGVVVTRLGVNTFIATLATSSLFLGAAYIYSDSQPVISEATNFGALGTSQWGGVWVSIFIVALFVAVGAVLLSRTSYGRSVFAVGGNQEAARLAGMRVDLIRISTFMITGVCAAVAGMITASQTGVGQANIGANTALDSIAIVIIGGTSLLGGEGAMWRTVIGLLIWGVINNIFSTLALDTSTQLLMNGAILLAAVTLDSFSRRVRT